MVEAIVKCDRCQKVVKGAGYPSVGMTAGYYHASGTPWSKYANPGEQIVCDECMWNDDRYRADYPPVFPPPGYGELPTEDGGSK